MPPRRMGTRANPAVEEDQGSHNQDRRDPENSEEGEEDYNIQDDSYYGEAEETFNDEEFENEGTEVEQEGKTRSRTPWDIL